MNTTTQLLYGAPDGRYVLAVYHSNQDEVIIPRSHAGLPLLGEPRLIVTELYDHVVREREAERRNRAERKKEAQHAVLQWLTRTDRSPDEQPPDTRLPRPRHQNAQQQLGELLGVSQSTVSKYLSGKSSPRAEVDWASAVRAWCAFKPIEAITTPGTQGAR